MNSHRARDSWFPGGGGSSVGRALDCGSRCRGFDSHPSPQHTNQALRLPIGVAFLLYGVTHTTQSACHPIALPCLGHQEKLPTDATLNLPCRDRHWFGGDAALQTLRLAFTMLSIVACACDDVQVIGTPS
jgi:hypothetical protein